MKHPIHQSNEDKLALTSKNTVEAVNDISRKADKTNQLLGELKTSIQDKDHLVIGFTSLVDSQRKTSSKLEEVKSAVLASNIVLKNIASKETPAFPKTDFTATNKLLTELLTEMKKPDEITVTLELDD